MQNESQNMSTNTAKTSENNASPSPAPVIRQSTYQVMADKAGVDREAVTVDIRKYIASNPEAAKWPKDAIFSLAITVHKLGLSLAPAMGEAFIMPARTGCELVIGYRGLLKLARKSGRVRGADAQVVRATDEFKLKLAGESYDVEWSADVSGLEDPGPIVGADDRHRAPDGCRPGPARAQGAHVGQRARADGSQDCARASAATGART